jgi:hypothetical protein
MIIRREMAGAKGNGRREGRRQALTGMVRAVIAHIKRDLRKQIPFVVCFEKRLMD